MSKNASCRKKRKRSKKVAVCDPSEMPAGPSSKTVFVGVPSNALLPAKPHGIPPSTPPPPPPPPITLPPVIKQEYDESNSSADTVITEEDGTTTFDTSLSDIKIKQEHECDVSDVNVSDASSIGEINQKLVKLETVLVSPLAAVMKGNELLVMPCISPKPQSNAITTDFLNDVDQLATALKENESTAKPCTSQESQNNLITNDFINNIIEQGNSFLNPSPEFVFSDGHVQKEIKTEPVSVSSLAMVLKGNESAAKPCTITDKSATEFVRPFAMALKEKEAHSHLSSHDVQQMNSFSKSTDGDSINGHVQREIKSEAVSVSSLTAVVLKENESAMTPCTDPNNSVMKFVSPLATTLKKNYSPAMPCTIPEEQSNLPSHEILLTSSSSKRSSNGDSINEHVQKSIKNEYVSPERNESARHRVSPKVDVGSSMCSSIENKHISHAVPGLHDLKASLGGSSSKFSTDCGSFLLLNVDFELKDIESCITVFNTKNTSYAGLENTLTSSNSFENISCVSTSNLKETTDDTSRPLYSNKSFKPSENLVQISKSSSTFINTPSTIQTTLKDDAFSKPSNSPVKVSSKFIDKESKLTSASKFPSKKLNEILKSAGVAIRSNQARSEESSTGANESPEQMRALDSFVTSQKRQIFEEFDFLNLQENNTFMESKKMKFSTLAENTYRKDLPVSESTRPKTAGTAGLEKMNYRNASEPPIKKLKLADFQNKRDKLQTQHSDFMKRNVEKVKEPSTCSPLKPHHSPPLPASDRVHPLTSSVSDYSLQNVVQNHNVAGETYPKADLVPRDPRLRRNVPSVVASATPFCPQTAAPGVISPRQLKKIATKSNVQKHKNAPRSTNGLRSDFSAASYHTSSNPDSCRLYSSPPLTDARELLTKSAKKAVQHHDVSFRIIGWNAAWLQMKTETIPPICKVYKPVKDSYESFDEYCNTYRRLHLLSMWLDIYDSWKEKPYSFQADLDSFESRTSYYKNNCSATIPAADMPINQGLIHITSITEERGEQCLFGFVYDVKQRSLPRGSKTWKDVKFSFYTVDKIGADVKSVINIRKLCKVRVAIKQHSSLESFDTSPLKAVMLDPKKHSREIKIIKIPSTATTGSELQPHVDKIIEYASSPDNRFTLAVQVGHADTLVILSLVRSFVTKRSTVLVCLRDTDRCFKIAEYLSYGFVLALKESETADIPEAFREFTLHANAARLNVEAPELEVLKSAKIILTVTSRIFLGDSKNAVLGSNLTCIIEHSSMSTELETLLPLSYGPQNVVLLGDPTTCLSLNPHLQKHGYYKSLFLRLFKSEV